MTNSEQKTNYFEDLLNVNVSDKIEKKNGLSYLSWSFAWQELKRKHPNANYKIYERENGVNYFDDGRTAWVKTGIIVENIEHIEYLPVMDFKNKSIPLDNLTSTDVNKAIQRSLTKAIARHGLGLYIYAGEDLPEGETPPAKTEAGASAKTGEDSRLLTLEEKNALRKKLGDEGFGKFMVKHESKPTLKDYNEEMAA